MSDERPKFWSLARTRAWAAFAHSVTRPSKKIMLNNDLKRDDDPSLSAL
jgi:hypothetical protein